MSLASDVTHFSAHCVGTDTSADRLSFERSFVARRCYCARVLRRSLFRQASGQKNLASEISESCRGRFWPYPLGSSGLGYFESQLCAQYAAAPRTVAR